MKTTYLISYLFIGVIIFGFMSKSNTSPNQNSKSVITEMYERHQGKWYSNLTFKQKTSFYQDEVLSKEETWYEAMKMPLGLIVKTGSMESGNGFIFKNDSMFVFQNQELVRQMPRVHDLLVLGFSVYFDPPTKTVEKLQSAGLDFSYFNETDDYFIIGNPDQKQVWIEKKRLLFTKIKSKLPNGNVSIIEFNKYEPLGNGWIAPEVLFFNNDKLTMKEEYYDIQIPMSLPKDLLNSTSFRTCTW